MENIKKIPEVTFSDVRTYVDEQFALGGKRKGVPLFTKTPKTNDFIKRVIKQLRHSKEKVLWIIILSHGTYPEIFVDNERLTKGVLVATATKLLVYKPERNLIEWIKGTTPKISSQEVSWVYDNVLFEAVLNGNYPSDVSSWIRISLSNSDFRFVFQRVPFSNAAIYNQKGEELNRWVHLLRLTFSVKSPGEVERIKQERIEKERSEQKKHAKEERERKRNAKKLLVSWEPDIWRDTTKSIIKTSAELWGSYDEIRGIWNNEPMKLGFKNEGKKYWIQVKHSDVVSIQNNQEKEMAFSSTINVTEEDRHIRLFYYGKDWYCIQAEISFSDAVALVEATKIKEQKKLQREIEKAKNLVSGQDDARRRQRISDSVKSFVWNRDGGKCVKCGSKEKLEFDHIVPFSKGGSDTARNLQLLCERCNRQKGNSIG